MAPLTPNRLLRTFALAACLLGSASIAQAHYRPLTTENTDLPKDGGYTLELGAAYLHDETFPFSGLSGNLWRAGIFRFEKGLGDNACVFVADPLYNRLDIKKRVAAPNSPFLDFSSPSHTDAVGSVTIGTRFRFSTPSEDRTGLGFQFSCEMPDTPKATGLAQKEFTALGNFIVERKWGGTDLFANVGFGLLGNPIPPNPPKDKVLYGLGFATPLSDHFRLLGEVNGRTGSSEPGTEDRSVARLSLQQVGETWNWDAGVQHGLETADADWGITAGVSRRWGP